jgi:hypothetical protein
VRVFFDNYAFRLEEIATTVFMPLVDNEHAVSAHLTWCGSMTLFARHQILRQKTHLALRRADELLVRFAPYDVWHRTYYDGPRSGHGRAVCTVVDMIPELHPGQLGEWNPHMNKRALPRDADGHGDRQWLPAARMRTCASQALSARGS